MLDTGRISEKDHISMYLIDHFLKKEVRRVQVNNATFLWGQLSQEDRLATFEVIRELCGFKIPEKVELTNIEKPEDYIKFIAESRKFKGMRRYYRELVFKHYLRENK